MKKQEFNEIIRNENKLKFMLENDILNYDLVIKKLIETRKCDLIFDLAKNVSNAPIEKLADAIISLKEDISIYKFAYYIKNAPIDKLTDAIIETKSAQYIYQFALNIKNANIDKLTNAIINTSSTIYIYYFALNIKNTNTDKLTDAIIKTNNAQYIYQFACDIKNANIDKLTNAIIKTRDSLYIYQFACNVENTNIEKLTTGIIETKSALYIYKFACDVKNANIKKLAKGIVKTNIINNICLFANKFPDVIEDIENDLIEIKNASYISLFARDVSNSNKIKLLDSLINLKEYAYVYILISNLDIDNLKLAVKKLYENNSLSIVLDAMLNDTVINFVSFNLSSIKLLEEILTINSEYNEKIKYIFIKTLSDILIKNNSLDMITNEYLLKTIKEYLKINLDSEFDIAYQENDLDKIRTRKKEYQEYFSEIEE